METKNLIAALCKAQASGLEAPKDAANPFFKSHYSTLESVWSVIRKPLTDNGLSVTQTTSMGAEGVCLVTTLWHVSGESVQSLYPINPVKNDPQAMSSAISYARRVCLSALVGVVQTDDDGEAASQAPQMPVAASVASPPSPKPLVGAGPSPNQTKFLWAVAGESKLTSDQVHKWIYEQFGLESIKDLSIKQFDALIQEMKSHSQRDVK